MSILNLYLHLEDTDFEETPEILLGSQWTNFWIAWGGGFISLGLHGSSKPLIMDEYKRKNTISSLYPDSFLYYGLLGTGVLWSTELCEETCEIHTTFGLEFVRIWPIQKSNNTYDVHFYVRANRHIAVRLYQSPGAPFPCFTVVVGDNDAMMLVYQETDKSTKQYLKELPSKGTHAVEAPWPPNCMSDPTDTKYEGSQWTAITELPCIPWISDEVPSDEKLDDKFVDDGSALKALNKCRNPSGDFDGTYCYALSTAGASDVSKQYCPIRACRSSECRMAGTANDYIGTLSMTRSGRICAKWVSDYDLELMNVPNTTSTTTLPTRTPRPTLMPRKRPLMDKDPSLLQFSGFSSRPSKPTRITAVKPIHQIDQAYFNDSLYPEHSARNASNYCRDPSRNMAGTWCYTTDPFVPQDLCNVRDCEKPEECTFLVKGRGIGRRMYIMPEHRSDGLHFSLKAWEPDQPDSITFVFTADDGLKSRYILKIGAANNEKVLLYHESEHEGCQVEITETERYSRILPLSTWSKQEVPKPDRLVLMIRAKGVVSIPLFLFPATPGFYALSLGEKDDWIYFMRNIYPNVAVFHKQRSPKPIFTTDSWTNITLKWTERAIDVLSNETIVFHYEHHSSLLFYFFSLAVESGSWATWTANCLPPDIDGPPLDGGWSEWGPWTCSASCGGGIGTRKRICNSPEPNVRGEPCLGPNTMAGRCNTNRCGDITYDTVTLIKRRIRSNHTALVVNERDPLIISSDPDIIQIITTESPDSEIQWSHNGIFVKDEKERIKITHHDIVIKETTVNDSGIYTITLHRVDDTYMIFKVVSLAVLPYKESVTIRETLPMSVTCHCVILGYVYSDLKVSWMIKDEVWKDYGITLPIVVNVDHVPAVNKSHEGMWKCVVEQNDLDFKWTTNAILVKVLGRPNWRTHLMEDKVTRPIFGWMPNEEFVGIASVVISLSLAACIIASSAYYIRFRESLVANVSPVKKNRTDQAVSQHKKLREIPKSQFNELEPSSYFEENDSSKGLEEYGLTKRNSRVKEENDNRARKELNKTAAPNLNETFLFKDELDEKVKVVVDDTRGEVKRKDDEPQIDAIKIGSKKRKRQNVRQWSTRKSRRVGSDEMSRSSQSLPEKIISKLSRRLSRKDRINGRADLTYKMRREEFFRMLKLYGERGKVAHEKQEGRRLIASSDTEE